MKSYSLLLLPILILLTSFTVIAQPLPVCESIAQDANGDGFGWVAAPRNSGLDEPHSCIVDETTQPAPVIINRETDTEVQLVRAYWDANRDLAERRLECERYAFSEDSNSFELTGSSYRYYEPLPAEKPWINTWTSWSRSSDNPDAGNSVPVGQSRLLWTVVDGVLNGDLQIRSTDTQTKLNNLSWVELIDVDGGSQNGTRWWDSDRGYDQCTDPVSNIFVPTGTPGTAASASTQPVFSSESKIFSSPVDPDEPNIVREEEIIFSRGAQWDIRDLAFKRIGCRSYFEVFDNPQNPFWKFNDQSAYNLMFLPGQAGSPDTGYVAVHFINGGRTSADADPWIIQDDGTMSYPDFAFPIGGMDWFELVSTGENDQLMYWDSPGSLTICAMDNETFDTPYTFRELSPEEHNSFLIKSNIDTSHCTSKENVMDHATGLAKSCVVSEANLTEQATTPDIDTNTTIESGSTDSGMSDAVESGPTEINTSINNDPEAGTQLSSNETGGGSLTWLSLWFPGLMLVLRRRRMDPSLPGITCDSQ